MSYSLPEEFYYTKNHEWLHVDENLATIGLTEYALNYLGEVLYIELPEDGQNSTPGQTLCSVESVLRIHDMITAVHGTVLEVNQTLLEDPSLINDDPLGDGWLLRIEIDTEKDLANLLRSKDYRDYIKDLPSTPENP
ncbi:Glycine cleavage system H protein [compost metagenome]